MFRRLPRSLVGRGAVAASLWLALAAPALAQSGMCSGGGGGGGGGGAGGGAGGQGLTSGSTATSTAAMVQAAMNVAQIQQMQRQRMSQQIEEFGWQQRILEGRRAEQQALAQRQLEARRIASAERRQAELSRRAASIAARQKDLSTSDTVNPVAASQGKLELARQLQAAGRADTAERYLEEIVASYPGTLAATEAAQLLNN